MDFRTNHLPVKVYSPPVGLGEYQCAHCHLEAPFPQGHVMHDAKGFFFECDPKNESRVEAAVERTMRAIENRASKKFSGYNNGGENGQRGSYIYKSGIGKRKS